MSQLRLYRLSTLSLLTHSLTTVNKIYYCQLNIKYTGRFCPGGFCPRAFCPRGILSRGILSEAFCPGVLSGGFCPDTRYSIATSHWGKLVDLPTPRQSVTHAHWIFGRPRKTNTTKTIQFPERLVKMSCRSFLACQDSFQLMYW